jgi:large subunit ribosomal protein L9
MQVILLRDIAGVGQKGSVKNVADGYALNHLIPNKFAQMATADTLKDLEKRVANEKKERDEQEQEWAAIAGRMKNFTLMVRANANSQGHLYKKITPEDIARILGEQGINVPPDAIVPKMPIKQSGAWPVDVELGKNKATITVDVITA